MKALAPTLACDEAIFMCGEGTHSSVELYTWISVIREAGSGLQCPKVSSKSADIRHTIVVSKLKTSIENRLLKTASCNLRIAKALKLSSILAAKQRLGNSSDLFGFHSQLGYFDILRYTS